MWVLAVVVVLVIGALALRAMLSEDASLTAPKATPPAPRSSALAEAAQIMREVEAEAAALMPEIEAEAARIHADLLRQYPDPEPLPGPEPESPVGPTADGGPTWMDPAEWADRVTAYRRQGRTNAAIRDVAEHLERRGPRDAASQIAHAQSLGYVAREEYLDGDAEADALTAPPGGLPDLWLEHVRDRLLVVSPRGWVNPRSRTAASRAGLWSFIVRGTAYHERAARAGDFRPGTHVVLVREPENKHDHHAIAVYAPGSSALAGYVPRGYAKRLAPILDGGADMVAVSTRGGAPGADGVSPQVLVVERRLWDQLNRRGTVTR